MICLFAASETRLRLHTRSIAVRHPPAIVPCGIGARVRDGSSPGVWWYPRPRADSFENNVLVPAVIITAGSRVRAVILILFSRYVRKK